MFPASPLYLYLFPKLGHYLLEPLYRYQASGQYPRKLVFIPFTPENRTDGTQELDS
jgi:hypothetical protein